MWIRGFITLAAVAALAPAAAVGQPAPSSPACPADIRGLRMGVQNLLDVPGTSYARQRAELAIAHLAGERLRALGGGEDRAACARLASELPDGYRAMWTGAGEADFAFYRVGDRYLVAIGRPGTRRRPAVPQLPVRLITFDTDFHRLADAGWP